jgi:hypothetical protein
MEQHGELGIVECELVLRNEREVSTRGSCTVLLPRTGGPAVPYPVDARTGRSR